MAAPKKNALKSELDADPLHGYTGFELLQLSAPALRKLLTGSSTGRQYIPERLESFNRKIAEFKKS